MDDKSKRVAGLFATSSLACIAFGMDGTGGLLTSSALQLIGSVSSNLLSTQVSYFNYRRLKSWMITEDPDQLNHDLQKALKAAVLQSLDNIFYLYEREHPDAVNLGAIKKQFKNLKKEISATFPPTGPRAISDNEIKAILYDDPDKALKQLYTRLEIHFEDFEGVSAFIQKHLVKQIQLCFGEVIKSPENTEAWRAFQRLLAEETRADIKTILQKQEELKNQIDEQSQPTAIHFPDLTTEQINELKKLAQELNQPLSLDDRLKNALDQTLDELKADINEILAVTRDTQKGVVRIEDVLNRQTYRIDGILLHVDTKWYSKKYVALMAVIVALLIGLGYTVNYYSSQPFSLTVNVHGIEGRNHAILQNKGELQLSVGNYRQTVPINGKGEAYFTEIPAKYRNEPALFDIVNTAGEPYNPLHPDSTYFLQSGNTLFLMAVLEGLDQIHGIVKDFKSGAAIEGARITVQDEETFSDEYGQYELSLPLEKQQQFQTIRAFKEGYQPFELSNIPTQTEREIAILMNPASN